jgi:hypothetical protein
LYTSKAIAPQVSCGFGYAFRFDSKGRYGLM